MNGFDWTRVCARGLLAAAALSGIAHAQEAQPKKPNIVLSWLTLPRRSQVNRSRRGHCQWVHMNYALSL
jgi:hypothetical protein